MAAVGLAQNFAALRALSTDGIQQGHMTLHARSVATTAGVPEHLFDSVVEALIESGDIKVWKAKELVRTLNVHTAAASRFGAAQLRKRQGHPARRARGGVRTPRDCGADPAGRRSSRARCNGRCAAADSALGRGAADQSDRRTSARRGRHTRDAAARTEARRPLDRHRSVPAHSARHGTRRIGRARRRHRALVGPALRPRSFGRAHQRAGLRV